MKQLSSPDRRWMLEGSGVEESVALSFTRCCWWNKYPYLNMTPRLCSRIHGHVIHYTFTMFISTRRRPIEPDAGSSDSSAAVDVHNYKQMMQRK